MSSYTPQKLAELSEEKLKNLSMTPSQFLLEDEDLLDNSLSATGISLLFKFFNYKIHTFQFIGKKNSTVHSPVELFTDEHTALDTSLKYNRKGYDVFFMVNEGSGIIPEGKKVPRCQQSVAQLSKCFIDTDNCPLEKVLAYLISIKLTPHLIIESSPNRFHIYFSFTPVPVKEDTLEKWKAIQNMLHRLGNPLIKNPAKTIGTDSTMHDYAKILRVPGFTHITKLSMVKLHSDNDLPLYTLEEIFTLTSAADYISYTNTTYGESTSNVPSLEGPVIEKGERFSSLQALSLHLANESTSDDIKYATFCKFIKERLDNTDGEYFQNDKLTQKSASLFTSALNKVKREQKAKIEVIEKLLNSIEEPSSWTLPDEFYLQAPNNFGDVVKQVMRYSLYPCASLSFGTFLTGLSILKSRTHLTPHGSSPALYTLNVAISGYGKNDPMTFLQNLFVANGLGSLISNEIRSDRGIYNHLASNNGLGLFILDEIAPLLYAIQDEFAVTHHANIAKAFLQIYSAGALKGISFGKIASSNTKKGEKEIVLDNPMCALLGYTVPIEFEKLFSSASVAKGLFQRFIPIVTNPVESKKSPFADKNVLIKSDLFTSILAPQELDDNGNPISPIQTVDRVKMRYTPEARKMFEELEQIYRTKLISTAKDPETAHTSGLYSRLAEQIERVATVLALEDINVVTLEYAIKFVESRHQATLEVAEKTILRGVGSKNMHLEDKLISVVAKLCKEENSTVVYKTQVYKKLRREFLNIREFDAVVFEAQETGKIKLVKSYKADRKHARTGYGITLFDIIED